ncbi:MAG: VWA domain-containing protein [Desulfurococcales archaeon]|nr:VWA domain-containing protein [Desulfurococcales archaeon]
MRIILEHQEAALLIPVIMAAYTIARSRWGRRAWTTMIVLHHPLAHRVDLGPRAGSRLLLALEALTLALLLLALAGPSIEYKVVVEEEASSKSEIQIPPRPGLILVIDVSGSMEGWKLDAVKRAASSMVEDLDPRIDVGLIAFNHAVETGVPPTDDRAKMLSTIEGLTAGGGTVFSYPLTAALDWLYIYTQLGLPTAIVLLSDGLPADSHLVPDLVEEIKSRGVIVYTIYTGETADGVKLMEYIAEETGGSAYRVGSEAQLLEAFREIGIQVNTTLVAEATARASLKAEVTVREPLSPYLALAGALLSAVASFYRYRASGLAF